MSAWGAVGGFAAASGMIVFIELATRFDTWARRNGMGWLMSGSREWAVTFKWITQAALGALAIFCAAQLLGRV